MSDDFIDDLDTATEADVDACYGSKYLSAADLGDRKIKSRIAKVHKEPMQKEGKPDRPKLVAYFSSLDKGLVLNATNKNTIVTALGKNPGDWKGAEIGLYTALTQFGGKTVPGVRVKVLSAPKAAAKPAPVAKPTAKPAPKPAPEADSEDPSFGVDEDSAGFDEAAE
jgi:hypothetical protein